MTAYTELVNTLTQLLRRVQPAQNYQPGLLGDGAGNVYVANRPNYSYVRLLADLSKIVQVFGTKVNGYDGLPILVGSYPWTPDLVQIIDVDWGVFVQNQSDGWDPTSSYVPRHGPTHLSTSSDPAEIDKDNIVPLHLHPYVASGTWWVEVNADFYPYASSRKYFQGGRFYLGPYITGSSHYITISVDPTTNSLIATNGPDFGTLTDPSNLEAAFPVPPIGNVIAGTVLWSPGATQVTQSIIFADRLLWQPLGGATIPYYGGATGTVTPLSVGTSNVIGTSIIPARGDHVHQGVHSIRATGSSQLYGDVQFQGISGTSIYQSGQIIQIMGGYGHTHAKDRWAATGGTTVFSFSNPAQFIEGVYINGLLEDYLNYTLAGDGLSFTLSPALAGNDLVMANYILL